MPKVATNGYDAAAMRTSEQRGRYGRWLVTSREARGWDTAVKALAALASAGITIGKSTYAEYESGTKVPSRNHLPLLEDFWGPVPDETGASPALADAIRELTAELRAAREERAKAETRLKEVERLVARLAAREFAAPQVPQPQPRSTESGR